MLIAMPPAGLRTYWFPAKRYGWGWGLPSCWQGWLVLAAFVANIVLGAILFPPPRHIAAYLAYTFASAAVFSGICWWKGEPPKWRWGGDGEDPKGSDSN
jgi:hypothetical protein